MIDNTNRLRDLSAMNAGLPPNKRLYAIGDIHGCSDLLRILLEQIVAHDLVLPLVETKTLVFLGDYIDRGADSREVIDILLNALPTGYEPVFLKGNHEAMLLDALEDDAAARFWMVNGGTETLASYQIGTSHQDLNLNEDHTLKNKRLLQQFRQELPREHRDFFQDLRLTYECGDYFFAHAGIHPDRPLDEQSERDLLWIRDRFLFSKKDFGKVIIHGHTPAKDVDIADNQIGIDTAAVYGGKLTALMLEGDQTRFLYVEATRNKPPEKPPFS